MRFRLVAWYAGLLTAVFLLFGLAMFQVLRHFLERNMADSQAPALASRSPPPCWPTCANPARRYVADEIKAWYAPENNDRFIRIYPRRRHRPLRLAAGPPVLIRPDSRCRRWPMRTFGRCRCAERRPAVDHGAELCSARGRALPGGMRRADAAGGNDARAMAQFVPARFAPGAAGGGRRAVISWWAAPLRRWCRSRAAPNTSPCII